MIANLFHFQPSNDVINKLRNPLCSNTALSYPSRTIVKAKLEMTEPGDHDEIEANNVANDIVNGGKISRKISDGISSSGVRVSSAMENQLSHTQGEGHSMPSGLQSMMENGFGRDFSQVRLHTDSLAADMSSSINAKAFTLGNDIYFNRGQYSPTTTEGQRLMAHELTHVAQRGQQKICKSDLNNNAVGNDGEEGGVFLPIHQLLYQDKIKEMILNYFFKNKKSNFSYTYDDPFPELNKLKKPLLNVDPQLLGMVRFGKYNSWSPKPLEILGNDGNSNKLKNLLPPEHRHGTLYYISVGRNGIFPYMGVYSNGLNIDGGEIGIVIKFNNP